MKKLCIFIYSLGGGGAEKAALELVKGLSSEYDLKLLLFCDVVKYELPQGLSYDVLDGYDFEANALVKLFKIPLLAYKYAKYCRENEIDISLSILSRPNLIALVSRLFGNRAKLVISEHSTLSRYYQSGIAAKGLKRLISLLYPTADRVIAVSSGCAEDLTQNFGVAPQKVQVVYNPIDIELIHKISAQPCAIGRDGIFTFVTCGRLIKSKNMEMVIQAFALCDIEKSRLVVIGEGEERAALEALADKLGVSDSVIFVGFTANPYAYFGRSDAFVFASRFEALPTVLIEALVCGLPVISTDCPSGPAEILCAGDEEYKNGTKIAKNGILVEMENVYAFAKAMSTLAHDEGLRERFVQASDDRANDFAKEQILQQYKRVLE
jgi:N-acetylgalactosamine-N,N'-diacetylbacillosaminyl-diphospho-undecaprenol 4-alpha-N-acetylgalactosaminyltransferase